MSPFRAHDLPPHRSARRWGGEILTISIKSGSMPSFGICSHGS
jgi:hypothetical protein